MLPYLCIWPSPLCSLHRLASTRCSTYHLMPSRISSMVHTSVVTQKELLHSPEISTESSIYQTGKTSRGLKGISTNPEQVAVWIESIRICSHLAMAIDEEGINRWELDLDDSLHTSTKLRKSLTHCTTS